MKTKLTICIPTYNRANYLPQTIDSVLSQTYTDFECIIWDDGSIDETETVVRSYKDKRISYYKNATNGGYIVTMNKCTRKATTPWIMHLSDDDLLEPTMIEEVFSALDDYQDEKIGFIVPQTITINEKGETISTPIKQLDGKSHILFNPKEFIFNFTLYGKKIRDRYRFNTSFPSTVFNREVLMELGMSSKEVPVSHDVLIESKICLLYPVVLIDKPLFKYRVHANLGSSLNRKGDFLREYSAFLKLLFAFVEERKITFPYDFMKYCYDSLITYLFSLNGGLVRLSARFWGPYAKRVRIVISYILFGIRRRKRLLISPSFYLSTAASLLPQKLLLFAGRMSGTI